MADDKPQLSHHSFPSSPLTGSTHHSLWRRVYLPCPFILSRRTRLIVTMVAISALVGTSKLLTTVTSIGPPTGVLTAAVNAFRHLNQYGTKALTPALLDPAWKLQDSKHEDFETISGPVLPVASNFADPAYIEVAGVQYAFATNSRGQSPPINVQVAQSLDHGQTWGLMMDGTKQYDALPKAGLWSTGYRIWAPDVVQLVSR